MDLGIAYWCHGRYSEAIATLEQSSRLREAQQGAAHPETVQSRNKLADALRTAGRQSEAIALVEETLRRSEDANGPHHPFTLQTLDEIATAYEDCGRLDDAERLRHLLVARRRNVFDHGHPTVAADLAGLGRNLLAKSKWSEAESHLRGSLASFRRMMPDDWRGYVAMNDLGRSLLGQGRLAEAEPSIVGGYEGLEVRGTGSPRRSGLGSWRRPLTSCGFTSRGARTTRPSRGRRD